MKWLWQMLVRVQGDQKMKIVAIIQARMSSTRLPGKVLQEIAGKPMLVWVVERARRAKLPAEVVVATTTKPEDDPLVRFCQEKGYPCQRGSLNDVLDRYYQTAKLYAADVIVRLTSDCPFIDPVEIDHVITEFQKTGVDFAANRLPPPFGRTYPIGLDTEVCSFTALERAWKEAEQSFEREHVMPYLYVVPGRFKVLRVDYPVDHGKLRWTVDTPADLELARQVAARFGGRDDFSWLDVLALFEREPELAQINSGVEHKKYDAVG
jgi:spore coat polysaccharide biosynthesis protein SpsF